MKTPRPLTAAELQAHSIAIEREAAARYSEFAERMSDLGNEPAAQIFVTLARLEAEHLDELLKRAAAFFESVVMTTGDAMLRALAAEMAADETDHIVMLEKLLETTPSPIVDWASVYERETS